MNTELINLNDDELTQKFAAAVIKAKKGNVEELAIFMADFNALQRSDDDPLKTALLKTSGMLMGGQVEALQAHQDTRQAMTLLIEWNHLVANPKFTKSKLSSSLQAVAWHFLNDQRFNEFKRLINFIKDMGDLDMKQLIDGLDSKDFQTIASQVMPAPIAAMAVEIREAKREKARASRKKKVK